MFQKNIEFSLNLIIFIFFLLHFPQLSSKKKKFTLYIVHTYNNTFPLMILYRFTQLSNIFRSVHNFEHKKTPDPAQTPRRSEILTVLRRLDL